MFHDATNNYAKSSSKLTSLKSKLGANTESFEPLILMSASPTDLLSGGGGDATGDEGWAVGTTGNEFLFASSGNELLVAGVNYDAIMGLDGDDLLNDNAGDDLLTGDTSSSDVGGVGSTNENDSDGLLIEGTAPPTGSTSAGDSSPDENLTSGDAEAVDEIEPIQFAPETVDTGVAGDDIAVGVQPVGEVQDGTVTITGVPENSILSAGVDNGDGVWTLTTEEAETATLRTPTNFSGNINLSFEANGTTTDGLASTQSGELVVDVSASDDPTNFITNGSFENIGDVVLADNGWAGFQQLNGWKLESGQQMEIVDSGHRGVEATDGNNWLDMEASAGNIAISQRVLGLENGNVYELTFDTINTGRLTDNGLNVIWNGERVFTVGSESGQHSLQVRAGSGDGSNTLKFESTDATPDNVGLALDNVRMVATENLLVNGSFENLVGTTKTGFGHSAKAIQGWTLEENGTLIAQEDFENGAEGWSNNTVTETDNPILTDFLGRFGGSDGKEMVSKTFNMQGDHNFAVIEFDFLKLDSWDANNAWGQNERLNIFLDGKELFAFTPEGNIAAGAAQLGQDRASGVSRNVRYVVTSSGEDQALFGHNPNGQWHERVYHVRLEISNPGEELKLGFGSTLNQNINDESFGIDNVKVFGADNPNTRLNADGTFSADGNQFEVHNPRGGVNASDGNYWLDMGGSASNVTIAQQIPDLDAGQSYVVAFDVADSIHDQTDGLDVIWNGQVVAHISGQDTTMDRFEFEVKAGSGDGTDTLKFRGTGDVNNFGVSLDNVTFVEGSIDLVEVEFVSENVEAGDYVSVAVGLADQVVAERSTATISGVPEGAKLTVGERNTDGSWTVPADQLAKMSLRTPTSFEGPLSLTVTLDAALSTSPNLVVNGSFEDNSVGSRKWAVLNSINGWTSSGGEGFEIQVDVAGKAADGNAKVELDSHDFGGEKLGTNSGMFQDIATVAGETYQMSFEYSPRPGVSAASNGVEVLWNGQVVKTVTAEGSGLSDTKWSTQTVTVEGAGATGRLEFRAIGTQDSLGGYIDNVELVRSVNTVTTINVDIARASDPGNLLVNGSFENLKGLTATGFGHTGQELTGWKLVDGPRFEVHNPRAGVDQAAEGSYWLDMDASPGNVTISQEVLGLEDGKVYDLSFSTANSNPFVHGGKLLNTASNGLEVIWNGEKVSVITNQDATFDTHSLSVRAGSGDGSNTLTFRGTGEADNVGISLDNVRMVPTDNLLVNGSFENLVGTTKTGFGQTAKAIQGWTLEENGTLIAQEDFENGAEGWSNNTVTETDHAVLTDFLGKFGGSDGKEMVSKTFNMQGDHNFAVMEFDFLKLDSWDANNAWGQNERLNIFLDGKEVLAFTPEGNIAAGAEQLGQDGASGVSGNVRYVITSSGTDTAMMGADNTQWNERVYHVRLEISNPGEELKLGFGSTLNQSINDESFGIDNVKVFGAENPNTRLNADGTFSADGNRFEVHNPRGGVNASDGNYWLDMGGSASNVTIAQQIPGVEDGAQYRLSFDLADSAEDKSDGLEVIWNGEVVSRISGQDASMDRFEFTIQGGSGDGTNTLKFRGTGDVNNFGVSLDNVKVVKSVEVASTGNAIPTTLAGAGNDMVEGGAGNDIIDGGAGDDFIDGGSGMDEAVYSGSIADYEITKLEDGSFRIADTRPDGTGIDTVRNVESFRFADGTLSEADLPVLNPEISTSVVRANADGTVTVELNGTSAPNTKMELINDGKVLATTQADADGNFKFAHTAKAGVLGESVTVQASGLVSSAMVATAVVQSEVIYNTDYQGQGGRIWGDPHFVGDDGGKYDIQGEDGKTYNLLSDKNLQINSTFSAWAAPGTTIMSHVGITAGSNQIELSPYGAPMVNGMEMKLGETIDLNGSKITYNAKNTVTVTTDEYVTKWVSQTAANIPYFDAYLTPTDPNGDFVAPHGLWGQTVDADTDARNGDAGKGTQGGGAIDTIKDGEIEVTKRGDRTSVQLYEVNDIFSTTAKNADGSQFFRFAAEEGTGLDVSGVKLAGTGSSDQLQGSLGDDQLLGGDGSDRLDGGAGDDFIDGGSGMDEVIYSGSIADYEITKLDDGSFRIADTRPDGTGIDTVRNVESFKFADGTLSEADLPVLNPEVADLNVKTMGDGSVSLELNGNSAPNVKVELIKDGQVLATTRANASGAFTFNETLMQASLVGDLTVQVTGKLGVATIIGEIG